MSAYITRYCSAHGDYEDDVYNIAGCPACEECPHCGGLGKAPPAPSTELPPEMLAMKDLADNVAERLFAPSRKAPEVSP